MSRLLWLMFFIEVVALAAVFAVLPRIARRGLLFGVHVGNEASVSAGARAVTRGWYRSVATVTVASLALFALVATAGSDTAAFLTGSLTLTAGAVFAYARAHRAARRLAAGTPPVGVALLEDEPQPASLAPLLTLALVVLAAIGMSAHAIARYAEMPERIPIHFGPSGEPDGWAPRSLTQVLLLPVLTLVLGGFLAAMAAMLGRAKRGLRYPGAEGSAAAGSRFRTAIARFLCAITVAVTALFASIHVGQVRVALGQQSSLGPFPLLGGLGMTLLSLGGVIYLMVRYGQAGARLEESGGALGGELTNGLADNALWKWGLFYVNREDPAIFVEKRFGLGYTINLGNPRAVALFGGFFLALIAIVVVAIVSG